MGLEHGPYRIQNLGFLSAEKPDRRRLHPGPGRWSGLELYDLLGCYFRERREAAEGYLFSREIILRGANSVES